MFKIWQFGKWLFILESEECRFIFRYFLIGTKFNGYTSIFFPVPKKWVNGGDLALAAIKNEAERLENQEKLDKLYGRD